MPGVPLDEAGRAQAAALAQQFEGRRIAAVLSSPVQRALETAAPIAARLGLAVATEPGFEEIDFGHWTGLRFDALDHDPAWHAWNRLRSLARCPGGEAMHEAQSRALAAIARLRAAYADAPVVIVSHSDVIKAALAPALGLSLDRLFQLTIDPASVSTLLVFDDGVRVDGINRRSPRG